MRHLILLFALIHSTASSEQLYSNDVPAGPKNHQGSSGDFGAMIIMTTDSAKALKNWSRPTAGVMIPNAEKVEKGKPIEALVFFFGCAPDEKGNCVAEVDNTIVKPDGSVYAEYKNTDLWRNKPAIPVGRLGLAVERVGLIAEHDDPTGIYRIHCWVKDLVGKRAFGIYSTFEVIKAQVHPADAVNSVADTRS